MFRINDIPESGIGCWEKEKDCRVENPETGGKDSVFRRPAVRVEVTRLPLSVPDLSTGLPPNATFLFLRRTRCKQKLFTGVKSRKHSHGGSN